MAMTSPTTIAEPNGTMAIIEEVGIFMRPSLQRLGLWKDISTAKVGIAKGLTTKERGLVQKHEDLLQIYSLAF